MPRPLVALVALAALPAAARPAETPAPPPTVPTAQQAMADARAYLTANRPQDAVAALERALPRADGSGEFLALLSQAYHDELKRLRYARTPDAARIAAVREKIDLLAQRTQANAPPKVPDPAPPAAPSAATAAPEVAPGTELVRRAIEQFKQGQSDPLKYAEAAKLFAEAMGTRVELSRDQVAAWAYCRVRLAAERLNAAKGDPRVAAEVAAEVEDALGLAPDHARLRQFGQAVLAAAGKPAAAPQADPGAGGAKTPAPAAAAPAAGGVQALEYGSFRVRYTGGRELAEAVARKAEEHRAAIFTRWSGPPGGAWQPVCEVVLHPTAAAFAVATRQPAEATGHAYVRLEGGRAAERRIDLRADDETLLDDALPRELTHVVLADLFPGQAPPRWAEEAMAVLAASPAEVDRYLRTVPRCDRAGELVPVAGLLELKGLPQPERITGFYVESVSLVDFLVRWKKERAFTTFLRDVQRYGLESALKRQYGVASPRQLEELWRENVLGAAR